MAVQKTYFESGFNYSLFEATQRQSIDILRVELETNVLF